MGISFVDATHNARLRGPCRLGPPAASRQDARRRAGPLPDAAAVRRRLVAAPHRQPPQLPSAHRPRCAAALPGAGCRWADAGPAWATAGCRPARAGHRSARPPARPGAHLDGGPTRCCARRAGHRAEYAPDAQVPGAHGRQVAAYGAHPRPQTGPREGRPRRADAFGAKKGAQQDRLSLAFIDECGFAPSQPVTYSWSRRGERTRIPYENPQGRRVNVLAAYSPYGSQPALSWGLERGSIISGQFVDWIQRMPRLPGKALVIVIDNGSLHCSWVVKEARATLRAQRIHLYYLPPYSPKLNEIEAIFGGIKAHELPERRYD